MAKLYPQVSHQHSHSFPTRSPSGSFGALDGIGAQKVLTALPGHIIILGAQTPNLEAIPLAHQHLLALVLPLVPSEGAPRLDAPVGGHVDPQRREGVCGAGDGEQVAAGGEVAEVEGVGRVEVRGVCPGQGGESRG